METANSIAIRQSNLLDLVKVNLRIKTDGALAEKLGVYRPVISNLRSGKLKIGATDLISIHEESGLSIKEIKLFLETGKLVQIGHVVDNVVRSSVGEVVAKAKQDSEILRAKDKADENEEIAVNSAVVKKVRAIRSTNIETELLSRAFNMIGAETLIISRNVDLGDRDAIKSIECLKQILVMAFSLGKLANQSEGIFEETAESRLN